jgi:copper homeostasis protein
VTVLVEACVESLKEALTAERAGAQRLELCDNLAVGGTTPSVELLSAVKRRVRIPVAVMIRPRGGSFVYTADELDKLWLDLELMTALGADMLVSGILTREGAIDTDRTRELVERAGSTPVTVHRAFDVVGDQLGALDTLMKAGVSRVLTSGGAPTAAEGVGSLAALVQRGSDRITVMAGGKVRGHNVGEIVRGSNVREVHARTGPDETQIRDLVNALSKES